MDYATYLQTEHWQRFSSEIKSQRPRCERCNLSRLWSEYFYGQDLNVHHLTYENLGHESGDDVRVLCPGCHCGEHGLLAPKVFSRPKPWWEQWCDQFVFPGAIPPEGFLLHAAFVRAQAAVLADCRGIRRSA